MCGIAGSWGGWSGGLVRAMTGALGHRGPDGDGIFDDEAMSGPRMVLGHTRLAIIDPDPRAAQPMVSASGRYVLTFNGEIYNFRALRRELSDSGVSFRTESDTEVLLELFARNGIDCLSRLDGIFAFALWDREARTLTLARDPLGIKPLYYAALPQGFLFASEIKALVAAPELTREIDPAAVASHLGFLWTADEATMLCGVRKLRPGHYLVVRDGGKNFAINQYYASPRPDPRQSVRRQSAATLTTLLDTVVADQMVADVPVGALLSGGLDSSAVVASMCRAADPARITTFCAGVPKTGGIDNFGDDIAHARTVARHLGVQLVEAPMDADLMDTLPAMIWALDEPTADFAAAQTQLLAAAARQAGIKVLLSGTGGDDLFTGYPRHRAALLYRALDRIPGMRAFAAGRFLRRSPDTLRGRRAHRLGELLRLPEDDMLREAMSFSSVRPDDRRALLAPDLRASLGSEINSGLDQRIAGTKGLDILERMLDLELNAFLPDHNLNYADKMAMQESVEIRVPLIDRRMVAFAATLPRRQKITWRWTKRLFRESQRGRLPEEILTRPKQGFGVPLRDWLVGPARPMLEELTGRDVISARGLFDARAVAELRANFLTGGIDAAYSLFPIMAMELWCRALDAHPPAAVAGE